MPTEETPGERTHGELPHDAGGHDAGEQGGRGTRGVGRRGLLGAAGGALLAGGLLGAAGTRALGADRAATPAADPLATSHPLRGEHQAGIVTPAQDYLFTAAFDLTTDDLEQVRTLMSDWCMASEQMTAGELVGGEPDPNPYAAPRDTGEAWGYPPSSLTLTVGVGRGVFVTEDGADRLGLADRLPTVLAEGMPRFAGDALQGAHSGGDLVVQACADDAQVAMHAIRNLTRIAFGTAALRWTQIGYGRTSSTSTAQETPRNLFGFKDGTRNLKAEDGDVLAEHLWIGPEDEGGHWLAGGTYLAVRKIRMHLEVWDRLQLGHQEAIIGRDKRLGAPLSVADPTSASQEFTTPDLTATGEDGAPLVPSDAHIAVVAPETNRGAHMLRRGFNYTDGSDSLGRIDGGLFFLAFVRDPRTGFYPVLERMTRLDALQEYLQHVASGLFAILPGVGAGDTMFGQALFGSPGSGAPGGGASGGASDAGR